MPSQSLLVWQRDPRAALDRLEAVHRAVTGGLAGRPRDVAELNHALFLRLAAELQGFCRDLHDEAIDVLSAPSQVPNPALRPVVRSALARARKLDRGNAGPGPVGDDWTILGMVVWDDLKARFPGARQAKMWNERLTWLNDARNGIAHNDLDKIAVVHAQHPLTLRTFRSTRSCVSRFAMALDQVTRAYLREATGEDPW